MCIGWAVMFFRRLKKPVCTAENHGLQTGYYQYNNFFGAAFAAGCICCGKGDFNFPLTFFAMGSASYCSTGSAPLIFRLRKGKTRFGHCRGGKPTHNGRRRWHRQTPYRPVCRAGGSARCRRRCTPRHRCRRPSLSAAKPGRTGTRCIPRQGFAWRGMPPKNRDHRRFGSGL